MVFVFDKNDAIIKLVLGKYGKRFFLIFFLFAVVLNFFVIMGNSISFDEFIDSYENYNSSDFVLKNYNHNISQSLDGEDLDSINFSIDFANSQGNFLIVYNLYELGNFSVIDSNYRLNLFCKKSSYFNYGLNDLDFNYNLFFLESGKSYLPKIEVYLEDNKIYSKNLDVIDGSDFNDMNLEIELETLEFVKSFGSGSYYKINSLCYYLNYNESFFEDDNQDEDDNINNTNDNNVSDDNNNNFDSSESSSGPSGSSGSSGGGILNNKIVYSDFDNFDDVNFEGNNFEVVDFEDNLTQDYVNSSLNNLNFSENSLDENLEESDLEKEVQSRIDSSNLIVDDTKLEVEEKSLFGKIVVGVGVVVMGLLGMILLA